MLFSIESIPTICEIAPLRFMMTNTEINNAESAIDRISLFSGIRVTSGVKMSECAIDVNIATTIRVIGMLR